MEHRQYPTFFPDLQDTPVFRNQIADRARKAESLATRSVALQSAAQRVCDALERLAREQDGLAAATEAFCGEVDEESVHIGCPLLRRFVELFADIREEEIKLHQQIKALLVTAIETDLCKHVQQIKQQRKTLARAEQPESRGKFRIIGKTAEAATPSQTKKAAEDARLALATSVNSWEYKKEHFFLDSYLLTARALDEFFEQGRNIMRGMGSFVEDMERTRQAALLREGEALERMQMDVEQAQKDFAALQTRINEAELAKDMALTGSLPQGPLQMTNEQVGLAQEIGSLMKASRNGNEHIWILKQGWLSKRASGRMTSGHWQRRWFVLQSDGSLYHLSSRNGEDRKAVANLHISTIKTDVKEKERASFCLVSPTHSYCLLADNELERQEWINSIQAVISWLLNNSDNGAAANASSTPSKPGRPTATRRASTTNLAEPPPPSATPPEGLLSRRGSGPGQADTSKGSEASPSLAATRTPARNAPPFFANLFPASPRSFPYQSEDPEVLATLWKIPGNARCADCESPRPEWASLTLGTLICIDCSGAHRQLGVHISKVRSTTLDVQAWDESTIAMFKALGNDAANSAFEALLPRGRLSGEVSEVFLDDSDGEEDVEGSRVALSQHGSVGESASEAVLLPKGGGRPTANPAPLGPHNSKPLPTSTIPQKMAYIRDKYECRKFVQPLSSEESIEAMWQATFRGDLQGLQSAVASWADLEDTRGAEAACRHLLQQADERASLRRSSTTPTASDEEVSLKPVTEIVHPGLSVLHVAAALGSPALVEYIWQQVSHSELGLRMLKSRDARGRTPLHYCLLYDRNAIAQMLLRRGAPCDMRDARGHSPLDVVINRGYVHDEALLELLTHSK